VSYKSDMKEAATAGSVFGLLTLVFYLFIGVLVIGGSYIGYLAYSFYAPRMEKVRYDTFKQSQAYNDGMIRDLENLKMEYTKANDEQKAALRAIVVHRFSVYDIDLLPNDLQVFYNSINR